MRSEITNFANRKFGDTLYVEYPEDGSGYPARFVSATVDEEGVATVNLVPDDGMVTMEVRSDKANILSVSDDTEWAAVQVGEELDDATVRFLNRLNDTVIYALGTVTIDIVEDWTVKTTLDPDGEAFTFTSEYWDIEALVPVKPMYPMPTEPGAYTTPDGNIWQFDPTAPWNQVWRNLTVGSSGTADEARPFGPFTPLVPQTGETA